MSFEGEIEQIPPMYSAIKKDGKKLFIVILGANNVDIRNNDMLRIIHNFFGYCK